MNNSREFKQFRTIVKHSKTLDRVSNNEKYHNFLLRILEVDEDYYLPDRDWKEMQRCFIAMEQTTDFEHWMSILMDELRNPYMLYDD